MRAPILRGEAKSFSLTLSPERIYEHGSDPQAGYTAQRRKPRLGRIDGAASMNYYPFHIGDFRSGTANMGRHSRWIYRDMMDVYYDKEEPLPLDLDDLCEMLGVEASEERRIVERLLRFKFERASDGYHHARCEKEIAKHHEAKANHWTCLLTPTQKAAMQAERNAAKASATPKWLTAEDRREIEAVYQQARDLSAATGIPHEVDHIVPLRSKLVCGLHVQWNLRAIPAHINRAKSNSFEVAK